MLCENCQKNQAVVHFKTIVNGEKREYALCEECAGMTEPQISFNKLLHGFLDSFINMPDIHFGESQSKTQPEPDQYTCSRCGLSFDLFKKTGRLGCSDCYTTFNKQMDAILKNIQGSSIHTGKFPKKYGIQLLNIRELENLRASLKKAIEDEEYEQAARIRDLIKKFEKGEKHD